MVEILPRLENASLRELHHVSVSLTAGPTNINGKVIIISYQWEIQASGLGSAGLGKSKNDHFLKELNLQVLYICPKQVDRDLSK